MNTPIRALLFDVDGTLYHQMPVRGLLAAELGANAFRDVPSAVRIMAALRAYRRAHEELRQLGIPSVPLAELQIKIAARRVGEPEAFLSATVDEWMFRRPLKYLRVARRAAVLSLIDRLRLQRIRLGVLSDYPPDGKLRSLHLAHVFSVVACTTDPAINALKPHPRGFAYACEQWGLTPDEVAYVGDRADVDAAGAAAAGMRCYLVGRGSAFTENKEGSNVSRRVEDLEQICLSAV